MTWTRQTTPRHKTTQCAACHTFVPSSYNGVFVFEPWKGGCNIAICESCIHRMADCWDTGNEQEMRELYEENVKAEHEAES